MFFFFNDTSPTEIYTLSLHDALPISPLAIGLIVRYINRGLRWLIDRSILHVMDQDRKSTRLNSSHTVISYAVFCLKKKKTKKKKQKQNMKNINNRTYTISADNNYHLT